MKLTPHSLATRARALNADIDAARHELGKLALQARREKVPGYLAVMKVACQRAESTISHWTRTQEWIECVTNTHGILPLIGLRYSFFEKAAQMSDRLSDDTLHETLWIWHDNEGATLESFRAHLDTLAGAEPGDVAEFGKWIQARVKQLQTKAEEYGLSKHSRDKILLAVAALKDALSEMEGELETA